MSGYQAEIKQRDSRLAQIDSQIGVDRASLPGISTQLDMANKVVEIQKRLRDQAAAANLDVMRAVNGLQMRTAKAQSTEGDLYKAGRSAYRVLAGETGFREKWRIWTTINS